MRCRYHKNHSKNNFIRWLKRNIHPLAALTIVWTISLLLVQSAHATSYVVSKTADTDDGTCDADCSLREAITAANADPANDTITFTAGANGTITLTSALPDVTNNGTLTITGNGIANTIINGANSYRHFVVNSGANLTLNQLTLENGNQSGGGAIYSDGTLTINNSYLHHNTSPGGGNGGAIFSSGSVSVTGSTFLSNSSSVSGGAIAADGMLSVTDSIFSNNSAIVGGAIYTIDTSTISRSTFSNNTVSNAGGALWNSATLYITNSAFTGNINSGGNGGAITNRISGVLTLVNSTISNNGASNGGGVFNDNTAILNVNNSIIANSSGGGDCFLNTGSTINAQNSLIEDGLSCVNGTNTNNLSGDPALNADLTLTASSLAINAGNNALAVNSGGAALTTDLAGNARIQVATVDMGAYESPFATPLPTVTISATDNSGAEAGSNPVTFRITRSFATASALTVNYTVGGTASSSDYNPTLTGSATIAASATFVDITLTPVDDLLVEDNETIILTLSAAASYTVGTPNNATATIINDDLPTLTINDVTANEGNTGVTNFTFIVSLSQAAAPSGVTFNIATANNTATAGSDYVAQSLTGQTIPGGNTTYTFTVQVNGDSLNEPTERFFVNVTSVTNAILIDGQGVGTIVNDDPLPSLSIDDVMMAEGNSGTTNMVFTVTLSAASGQSVGVNYVTANNTATAPSDYSSTSGSVTFTSGQTTQTITVQVLGDTVVEGDETFFVNLSSATNATIADNQGIGTIQNDDIVPVVTISPATQNIAEGSNANFTISRTGSTTSALAIDLTITLGSGTVAADYTLSGGSISGQSGSVTVTIPASSASVNVNLAAADDVDAEADNTVTLALVDGAAYDLGATSSSTATIPANDLVVTNTNDSGEGSLRQAILNANAIAGSDTITFTVNGTITLASTLPDVTSPVTITGNGTANTIIRANANPNTATYRIVRTTSAAGNLTLNSVTLRNGGNAGVTLDGGCLSADTSATLSVINSVIESCYGRFGGGIDALNATLNVTGSTLQNNRASRDGGGIDTQTSTVAITNSTITGNFNDNPGSNGSGGGISVISPVSFTMTGSTVSNNTHTGSLGGIGGGLFYSGVSGVSGTIINSVFTGNSTSPTVSSADGGGIYYSGSDALTLINSVLTNNTATDAGGGIYSTGANLTLKNVTLSGNSGAANRGGLFVSTQTVNLHNTLIANNTGGDCIRGSGTVNAQNSLIEGGLTCVTGTNTNNLTGDPALNGDLTLSAASLAINAGNNSLAVDQNNNPLTTDLAGNARIQQTTVDMGAYESAFTPPLPTVTLSATDNSGSETGPDAVTFRITRSFATASALTVNYTVGGTASSSDYNPTLTGSVTINANATFVDITLTPLDDPFIENVETIILTLAADASYTVGTPSNATATITSDDVPSLSINDVTVSEGDGGVTNFTFHVSLFPVGANDVTFNIATADGTATAGSDYVAQSLTNQTISAGVFGYDFVVQVNGDTLIEPNETFFVNVTNITNATIADNQGIGTIQNDDFAPVVTISPATQNIAEGSNADFTLIRTGFTTSALTVDLGVTLGTGTGAADYTLSGGSISGQSGSVTVTIPAGQASVAVNLAATDDIAAEADNTVTFNLVDGAAYDLGATSSSTATIPANDFVVTNTNDSGEGSLRQAILNANAFNTNDTITFAASANGTITLSSTLPSLVNNGTLTITGNGASNTVMSGNNAVQVFTISFGANVSMSGLKITQGYGVFGGGIYNFLGTVTLTNSTLSDNSAALHGGGINNVGTMTLINSTLSGNSAIIDGGDIFNSSGTVTLINSTLSGGGLYNEGTATINNSILANSTSGEDCVKSAVAVVNARNSLIESGLTCVNGTNTNNLTGDPALNADLTLSATSLAINAGDNSLIPMGISTDLAGNARIQQGTVDMGAYESNFIPTVTISATDNSGSETGPDAVTFRITRSFATASALTVNYTVGGTASSGDYTPTLTGSATITANATFVDITLTPVDDSIAEGNETVSLTLTANAAYTLGATTSDSATISDNDTAGVSVSTGSLNIAEGGATGQFSIQANTPPTANVTFSPLFDSGQCTLMPSSITLTSGNTTPVSVTVTAIDDSSIEGGHACDILLGGSSSLDPFYNGLASSPSSIIVSITDNDFIPVVTISPGAQDIAEGSNANVTISRTGSTASALTVDLTILLDTNTVAADYTLTGGSISGQSGAVTVTIPAGQASVAVNLAATDDIDAETDNTVTFSLVDGAAYDLGAITGSLATIPANDLVVTNTNDSGEGSLRQAITNANAFNTNDTITFVASANGTITLASLLPNLANNGTLTITGNGAANTVISGNNVVQVFTIDTGATVNLSGLTITRGNSNSSGGGISNNGMMTLTNSILSSNTTSGAGGGIYSASNTTMTIINSILSGNSARFGGGLYNNGGTLTLINSTLSDNSATNGGGITNIGTATLHNSIIANSTSGSDCVLISSGTINAQNSLIEDGSCGITNGVNGNLTGDPALNGDFTLSAASLAINAGNNSLAVDQNSNPLTTDLAGNARIQQTTVDMGAYESSLTPPLPTVTISATDNSGSETGPDAVTFRITRSFATASALTVNYTVGGTASSSDYTPTLTGSATITANATFVDITLTPVDDSIAEGNETVSLTLTANAAYTLGATTSDSATISDNDTAGITVSPTSVNITEGGATDTFSISANTAPSADVTVPLSTDGQCTVNPTSVTLTNGNTTAVSVTVTAVDDVTVEGAHTCTITTGDPSSSDTFYDALLAADVADVTANITDNDFIPVVSISPGAQDIAEGSNANVTISRTGSTTSALTVDLTILLDTNTVAADYTLTGGSISGQSGAVTVTIPAGQASVAVNLAATDDIDAETDNTVTFSLVDGAAYDLGAITGSIATIPANDLVVTNTNDSGEGSLRQAITNANTFNTNDTITFAASANGTITLASTLPDLVNNGTLTITGNGAANTVISGNNTVRAFSVAAGATVNLSGLTITQGNSNSGGGLYNDSGSTVTLINSTLSGNSANISGGGIDNIGTLTLINSTLSGNSASNLAGGINNGGTVTLINSTLSGNSATQAGGISNSGTLNLNNSLLANSTSGGDCVNNSGTVNAQNSLIEDGSCGITNGVNGNLTGDPVLNGDLTLSATSLAINAGDNSLAVDQNNNPLTTDLAGNARIQQTTVDMGAYESNLTPPLPTVTLSATDNSGSETGPDAVTFRITRSFATASALTVNYTAGGTASSGDYTPTLTGSAVIFANETFVDITLTPVDDAIVEGNETVSLTLTANAAYTLGATTNASATITDNDTAGITVSPTSVNIAEGGATASFSISANTAPSANVTVPLTTDSQCSVNPTSVTLTSGNTTAVSVTVTAANDTVAEGAHTCTITTGDPSSSDTFYDALLAADVADVTAMITDNDSAGITVTPTSGLTTTEAGGTAQFSIVLTSQPTDTVTIALSSNNTAEGTVSPASVAFTTVNWNTAQTVTVTGVDDLLVDGNVAYTIETAAAVSNDKAFNGVDPADVSVTNNDDDTAGFTLTESNATTVVSESGTTDSFTVVLNQQPLSDVVLTLTASDPSEATVAPAMLTFTPMDWDQPQTVTVTGVDDLVIDGTQTSTVTVSVDAAASDDAFDALPDQIVSVDTTDDDAAGFTVTESNGSTQVSETGTTDTLTVVLDAQPLTDVVLTLASDNTLEATVNPTTLIFTAANWDTPQPVTVTGVDDALLDGNQISQISVSVDAALSDDDFDALAPQAISVTTVDNDLAGFTLMESAGSTQVSETGSVDTFTVVLNAQPTRDVVFNLRSDDTGEATVSPSSLTFTSVNWNTPQTVTVTGIDDLLLDGNQVSLITVSVDSLSDAAFTGLADQTVMVTTTDDDTAGFTVTASNGSTQVSESGTTDSLEVVLNAAPSSDVVIAISRSDTGEATVNPTTLTFTPNNWNTPQPVEITGVDDALVDGDQLSTVTFSIVAASSDNAFDALTDQTVTVTTTDDDGAGITVTPTSGLTTTEAGGTAQFSIVLNSQPTANVTISLTSNDTGEGTVSPVSLTFTTSNWNTAQTVTVTGVDDTLVDGNIAYTIQTAAAVSNDSAFNGVNPADVSVTNSDDDSAGITVTPTSGLTTTEAGGTAQFSVVLNSQPTANVTIALSSSDTGEGTVSPVSLTFTTNNWNTAQTVTVTGVDDTLVDGNIAYTIQTAAAVQR